MSNAGKSISTIGPTRTGKNHWIMVLASKTRYADIVPNLCLEYLTEPDWQEGFECSLQAGHYPETPHRCEGEPAFENVSTDDSGRMYRWVFEWTYDMKDLVQ